jgi:hypothetical protein
MQPRNGHHHDRRDLRCLREQRLDPARLLTPPPERPALTGAAALVTAIAIAVVILVLISTIIRDCDVQPREAAPYTERG